MPMISRTQQSVHGACALRAEYVFMAVRTFLLIPAVVLDIPRATSSSEGRAIDGFNSDLTSIFWSSWPPSTLTVAAPAREDEPGEDGAVRVTEGGADGPPPCPDAGKSGRTYGAIKKINTNGEVGRVYSRIDDTHWITDWRTLSCLPPLSQTVKHVRCRRITREKRSAMSSCVLGKGYTAHGGMARNERQRFGQLVRKTV